MRVLLAYASRHGSTREIAEAIARRLRAAGHAVDVREASEVGEIAAYGAVVLGSAIYSTAWLTPAAALVHRHLDALAARPVWLFSVGTWSSEESWPFGAMARGEPKEVAGWRAALHARDYHVFAGSIQGAKLPSIGRLFYRILKGRSRDFRNWREVDAWADGIARELADGTTASPSG